MNNYSHLPTTMKNDVAQDTASTKVAQKVDRKIIIIDDVPPEGNAMLQALYSRSPKSVTIHLDKVREVGPEKFMGLYYVGYGHKSIGDCGTTTVYAENVSMLVAKAIQDWPLYNGQEASTRYLNMAAQPVLNPLGSKDGELIQKEWMRIYNVALAELVPFLKNNFPKENDQDEKIWEKAINAKAFDIARSLLPAGTTTLLSWHTNLRQAHDHLKYLEAHPLLEVREVAAAIRTDLKQKYTNSFSHKNYPTQDAYIERASGALSYFYDASISKFTTKSFLDTKSLQKNPYKKLLTSRPEKTELPQDFRKFGALRFSFLLDFGSYRDLQRHRSMICPMPLLTTKKGFLPWYLSQMPPRLATEVKQVLAAQEKRIKALKTDDATRQYYISMGYAVTCEVTANLQSALYIAELRSGQMVHPTLRPIAQQMGEALKKLLPDMALHCDFSEDKWSIKRGTQDIVRKK